MCITTWVYETEYLLFFPDLQPLLIHPVAAVAQGQNFSGLKQHSVIVFSSGGQKSKVDLSGLKLRFGRIVFLSGSSKGESISLLIQL